MQNRFDLLVADVMPIYMIMPRYSHNYALFYQLLDSNLFTHRNTYAILREATSETYGPRVYFPSYKFPIYNISFRFTSFAIFYFPIYKPKIPKIFTLSFIYLYHISLLQVTVKGLTTPLSCWVQVGVCLCRYSVTWVMSPTGLIPWFSKLREILTLLCCITLSSSRENQRKLKR